MQFIFVLIVCLISGSASSQVWDPAYRGSGQRAGGPAYLLKSRRPRAGVGLWPAASLGLGLSRHWAPGWWPGPSSEPGGLRPVEGLPPRLVRVPPADVSRQWAPGWRAGLSSKSRALRRAGLGLRPAIVLTEGHRRWRHLYSSAARRRGLILAS